MNTTDQAASKAPDTVEPNNDTELVTRVQQGDDLAFAELYQRYHRRAYAVALGVVKRQSDALDVVQEAFVKAHRSIEKFEGSARFYTWFYRIVTNVAIDHLRKRQRSRIQDVEHVPAAAMDQAAATGLVAHSHNLDPGKNALRGELRERIRAALAELPEHHRAVVVLREIEGMSYEEISEAVGVPKGTVMSRLFHARRKLQVALQDYDRGSSMPGPDPSLSVPSPSVPSPKGARAQTGSSEP